MRKLLDINVLIALMDSDHSFHQRAHAWWTKKPRAWASCPLTENGLLRIMTSPSYSKSAVFTVETIARQFSRFVDATDHVFWPDSISLRDARHFRHACILSSKHLTDLYLLALAVKNRSCLVTFDQRIPLHAVPTATAANLAVI